MNPKNIVILFIAIVTIAMSAMNPPSKLQRLFGEAALEESSSEESSTSSESGSVSSREGSVRERPVKRLKNSNEPVRIRPTLNRQVETLIERAAVPQAEIDNFFLDISDAQIRVLNKIIFFNDRGQQPCLMETEMDTFDTLPEFVQELFKYVTEAETEFESRKGY